MSVFRDKPSIGTSAELLNDDMMTDEIETASKQHDDTISELAPVLLQNDVRFFLLYYLGHLFINLRCLCTSQLLLKQLYSTAEFNLLKIAILNVTLTLSVSFTCSDISTAEAMKVKVKSSKKLNLLK